MATVCAVPGLSKQLTALVHSEVELDHDDLRQAS